MSLGFATRGTGAYWFGDSALFARNWDHLISNTVALLVLGVLAFRFSHKLASLACVAAVLCSGAFGLDHW